jgi:ADP-L-glycero-D-manno-heptose 6-epimerase
LKRILLTGSEGFIGKSIFRSNLFDIHYVVDIESQKLALRKTNPKSELLTIDPLHLNEILPKDVTDILHFGAITSTLFTDETRIRIFNTYVTNSLVDVACKRGINLVFASSASVYSQVVPMNEDLNLTSPNNLYAKSKWESEQYINRRCNCEIPHITALRLFNIYGRFEEKKGAMSSIVWRFVNDALRTNKIVIFTKEGHVLGSQSRDFVFVDDLVRFLELLMNSNRGYGLLNFGTGISHAFSEIVGLVSARKPDVKIDSILLPDQYSKDYQWYTQSDSSKFSALFPEFQFTTISVGLQEVFDYSAKI